MVMSFSSQWSVLSILTGHMNHTSDLSSLAGEVNSELSVLCRYSQMASKLISILGSYSLGISFKFLFIWALLRTKPKAKKKKQTWAGNKWRQCDFSLVAPLDEQPSPQLEDTVTFKVYFHVWLTWTALCTAKKSLLCILECISIDIWKKIMSINQCIKCMLCTGPTYTE